MTKVQHIGLATYMGSYEAKARFYEVKWGKAGESENLVSSAVFHGDSNGPIAKSP